jgi:hypothetical protein
VTADRGWKRPFDDPIPLSRGRQLVTLEPDGTPVKKSNPSSFEMFFAAAGGTAHASSTCSQDRVNLHFFMDCDPAKGNAAIVYAGRNEEFREVSFCRRRRLSASVAPRGSHG